MKIHFRNYLPFFIGTGIFLLVYLIGIKVPEATIRQIIYDAGPFGTLVFIFLMWLTNIIAPLSGSPFLFIGFYLYGQTVILYAFIAAVIASITNFWISKIWGRMLVDRLAGKDALQKIDKLTQNYGYQTLFIFRIFLKEFHDVLSYAFGLTSMRFWPYFLVSTFGMVPATLFWYYISLKIKSPLVFTVINWIMAYVSLTGYFLWIKLRKKKIK